jgi:hypothetical protein
MLRHRLSRALTEYVHFMWQIFDDYNETCEMIDGSAAIHPHFMGLLMLRGISNNGSFGRAKQCAINAFEINYLLYADEVMANILHLAQNMEEELPEADATVPSMPASPISSFVVAGRGHAVDVATTTVVVAVDVTCPTSAVDVVALTISSRLARRHMMPS